MPLTLHIQLLGELFITEGDRPVTSINSARSQALLAYLILHRHAPQPRSRLAFHLWTDSTDTQARTNLRKELTYLRRGFPQADQFLLVESKTLQWLPVVPFTLDVMEFENALKAAETADAQTRQDLLKQAIALYKGDLLPSCEDEWIVPERERLQQWYINALEQLIDQLQQQQDYRTALGYAQQLLRVDALNEATYCTVMRLYNQNGDRANALQVYHRCMTTLREELGVDPSSTTRKLYERLLHEEEATNSVTTETIVSAPASRNAVVQASITTDWGEAIDVSVFYGRETERSTLQHWIVRDRCRLVVLLGMGGIGKTTLAVKLAQDIQHEFECVIWRSLRNAPLLETLLAELVPFVSNQQETRLEAGQLIHWLRSRRCLVILDNAETLFQPGDRAGQYRSGYESYRELFKMLCEVQHQSCVLLTSREKPSEIAVLEGAEAVRSLPLDGSPQTAQALIEAKGLFGSAVDKQTLAEQYGYNPLALKIVASSIQDIFDGDIEQFLQQNAILFNGVRQLLEEQFKRLSDLEQTIMIWLAINREWTAIAELAEDIIPSVSRANLLEALESLRRRSLIERRTPKGETKPRSSYTQQSVVMEYVTDTLTKQIAIELATKRVVLLNSYALIKTTVKDYVRDSQIRLILDAIANKLYHALNTSLLKEQLQETLQQICSNAILASGYATGNLINLCVHLELNLTGWNFSRLTIRHAYLQAKTLHQVDFTQANFVQSVFTQTFGTVFCAAFSPDGQFLAIGELNGRICFWRVADNQLIATVQGHADMVRSVSFNPDGTILASASFDRTVKLWDVQTNRLISTLEGHTAWVSSVSFNPDGTILASASFDRTVKLWDVQTNRLISTLEGHTAWVSSVSFNLDGTILASGSSDSTVKLWDVGTGQLLMTLEGHRGQVWSVDFNPDSTILASGSFDQTIRLWNVQTGQLLTILEGHTNWVLPVCFSPDGMMLASASSDRTIKLWDVQTKQLLSTLQRHRESVLSVCFSPDGTLLASGSEDHTVKLWDLNTKQLISSFQGYANWILSSSLTPNGTMLATGSQDHTVKLWDLSTGKILNTLQGHTGWVWSVCFSPNGTLLASSSEDCTIKLWDRQTGKLLHTLQGHTNLVRSVYFSPDGMMLASGSFDQTIKLWNVATGQLIDSLEEHTSSVWSVCFSPDGTTLASGSSDRTVKLWNVQTKMLLNTLIGQADPLWSVCFSPDGTMLASGSYDCTVKLWDVATGKILNTLEGHTAQVTSVSFSPDGTMLASSSYDCTVKLWEVTTGRTLHTLEGHTNWVLSVIFSHSNVLISSSADETIRIWDIQTGNCLNILRADRPYEGMNITDVSGITEVQKAMLKALGAIEAG
jgi:WD40 repeat protein/DNA-binding SARP family transcriptional activator